jgi:hypothetical protein
MNKTNDTSSDVAATSEPELTAAELETVTGGRLLLRLKVPDNQADQDALDNKHQADAMKTFGQILKDQ